MNQERSATAGITKTATCAAEETAVGDDDRAPVLRCVADDRDDHRRDEEVREPGSLGEGLERAHENLRDERGQDGRDPERDERQPQRPGLDRVVARRVELAMATEREQGHDDVDHEEDDRDRDRDDRERVAVRIAAPARYRGDEEEHRREGDERERD
jgi:hypothetical protein